MKIASFIKIALFIHEHKRKEIWDLRVCCATACGGKVVRSTKGGCYRFEERELRFEGRSGR